MSLSMSWSLMTLMCLHMIAHIWAISFAKKKTRLSSAHPLLSSPQSVFSPFLPHPLNLIPPMLLTSLSIFLFLRLNPPSLTVFIYSFRRLSVHTSPFSTLITPLQSFSITLVLLSLSLSLSLQLHYMAKSMRTPTLYVYVFFKHLLAFNFLFGRIQLHRFASYSATWVLVRPTLAQHLYWCCFVQEGHFKGPK